METIGAIGAAAPATSNDRFSELSSEQFVKIIFTELSNQDPLKPNDTGALLDQLSTLRSIQSDIDLSTKLETLVTQNELMTAASMIGKFVTGTTQQGEQVEDFVFSVSRTQSGPVLNLDSGQKVALANIFEIIDLSRSGEQPAGGAK